MEKTEAEKQLREWLETIRTISDTQTTQARVIDKLSDGLLTAINIIGELRTRVEILEAQIKTITSGGM